MKDEEKARLRWEDEIQKMAKVGCTLEDISFITGLSIDDIEDVFYDAIKKGLAEMRYSIRLAQMKKGVQQKDTQMLIWLGKIYLGQKEPKHEVDVQNKLTIAPIYFDKSKRTDAADSAA